MFDNYNSIPEIHELSQIIEEQSAVSGMKTDGGFIQDVGDSLESRTHLGREPDTLGFTT